MDQAHREVLRKQRLYLSNQILVSDTIVQFLYQENILTASHVEEIESQNTSKRKTLSLLDVLPTRGPRAFDLFMESLLQDFSWVRDSLLQLLEAQPAATGPGSEVQLTLSVSKTPRLISFQNIKNINPATLTSSINSFHLTDIHNLLGVGISWHLTIRFRL
ncbi:death domain-containing protein CRADD [Gadus macrocephalus]|uniref:death domain-containing protein CRADD n=1 Tax=Gadus macrocephalus TaxID=80720 RepID=UPI0028CB2E48|nr:death domain-containing protein CRADD [Gadus macrocephalus]